MSTTDRLLDYVHSIRNLQKRAYARAYIQWLSDESMLEPHANDFDLGVMGAQAVRMNVDDLMRSEG